MQHRATGLVLNPGPLQLLYMRRMLYQVSYQYTRADHAAQGHRMELTSGPLRQGLNLYTWGGCSTD